jgi:hypothetical protein
VADRISQRRRPDRCDGQACHYSFGTGGIDDGSAGHLPDQADDAADREHKADLDLGPFLRGQIDRHEWPETGLHVGQKEDEPIEPVLAFARRLWRRVGRRRFRYRWRKLVAGGRSLVAIVVDPVQRRGRMRGQTILL